MWMERPEISAGERQGENTIKEECQTTLILPLKPGRYRVNGIKAVFFLFLLVFFVFCVWLTACTLFGEGQQTASAFADFFIKQGIGVPK